MNEVSITYFVQNLRILYKKKFEPKLIFQALMEIVYYFLLIA